MATFVFGMNQSLDGYVDHEAFGPSPTLFRHFINEVRSQSGCVYGRVMYDIMRYWDGDDSEWGVDEKEFAKVWRSKQKWVVSTTSPTLGPNATFIEGELSHALRVLKSAVDGEIEVAGPNLANHLSGLGLIDEYRLYVHPVVLGAGTPLFHGPIPPLRLIAYDLVDENVVRLRYVPVERIVETN